MGGKGREEKREVREGERREERRKGRGKETKREEGMGGEEQMIFHNKT